MKSDIPTTVTLIQCSIFVSIFTLTWTFYTIICFYITVLHLFTTTWKFNSVLSKSGQNVMNSLNCYFRKCLSLLDFWRTVSPGIVFLVFRAFCFSIYFFSAFWIYNFTYFWLARFQLRNLLIVLWRFLWMWQVFLCSSKNSRFVFDFWQFDYNVSLGLPCWLSFKLLELGCTSPSSDLGSFWPLFLHISSPPHSSLFSPSKTPIMQISIWLMVPHKSLFFFLFL